MTFAPPFTQAPRSDFQTFLNFELALDLENLQADVAILGLPYGDPYSMEEVTNDQSNAPTAVRRASQRVSIGLDHWDFDLGGPLTGDKAVRIVDCGDVIAERDDLSAHYARAEAAARRIFGNGALLISIGGDHGVPIPVLRALDSFGDTDRDPIVLVQVDAHLDWRDEVNSVREGYSSPIRRASELDHIGEIFQIGLRCQGSARREEVEAARAYGSHLISDEELQDIGMKAVLERIPDDRRYYLTIDADGLDPAVMPAVAGPAPGGLSYLQARQLIQGLARKGRMLGMDIVEITPARDHNEITSITAGNLILNMIGAAVRAGYFD